MQIIDFIYLIHTNNAGITSKMQNVNDSHKTC